jgi:hypothetical protein
VGTSLRGGTFQKLHVSEYGKIAARYPDKAKEIKTGALNTVHAGQQIFVESTAEGNQGEFYDLCKRAMNLRDQGVTLTALDPKLHFYPWFRNLEYQLDAEVNVDMKMQDYFKKIDVEEKFILSPQQKAWYIKKWEQQGEEMKREFPSTPEEAFEQSMEGAYFTRQMTMVRKDGGVGRFPYMPNFPVYTFWDLGMNDSMAIWFMQHIDKKYRFIDYMEDYGEALQYYIDALTRRGYMYKEHFWPHDGTVKDLSTGKERRQTAMELGLRPITIIPRTKSVNDDIQLMRDVLPLCEFDDGKCSQGIAHLDNYRKEWDDRAGVWKDRPRHDQASHGADAFRAFAVGFKNRRTDFSDMERGAEEIPEAEDFDYDLFSI